MLLRRFAYSNLLKDSEKESFLLHNCQYMENEEKELEPSDGETTPVSEPTPEDNN